MHFSEKDFPKDLTKKTWSKSDKNINSPHTFTMKNKLKTPFLSMDLWTRVRLQSPNPSQPSFCANLTGVKKSPSPTLGTSNFHIWASWNNQLYARRASKNIYRILTNLSIFTYLLIFIYRVWSWGNILGAKWAPYQINFGSPHNLLGAHQARIARLPPRLQGALRQGVWDPPEAMG